MKDLHIALLVFILAGCGDGTPSEAPSSDTQPKPTRAESTNVEGKKGEGEKAEPLRVEGGKPEPKKLVGLSGLAGDVTVTAQLRGQIEPGGRVVYLLAVDRPIGGLRLWIGVKDGSGSMKAKAHGGHGGRGGLHAHVEVPDPLPKGARLWLQVEDVEGKKSMLSLPLR